MTINLFEYAARHKVRFTTPKGVLTAEQLWDLPLSSDRPETVTLDSVARGINVELKSLSEESFVAPTPSEPTARLTILLDLVKHIIAVKLAEQAAAATKREKDRRRQVLTEALAQKDSEALKNMSREDVQKELAELG